MSTRSLDWSPLAHRDPIGGDPDAVRGEATYYSGLEREIRDQVTRLRKIAAQDGMLGETADKLRSAAGETADKLDKTHGRVEAVSFALTRWLPQLEIAQAETGMALAEAKDAVIAQGQNAPPPPGTPPAATDAQVQNQADRARRHGAADDQLAAARRRFDAAVREHDDQAKVIAGKINDSLHDGLKDGFWDHISHFVTQHIKLIRMVVEVMSWVATAMSIATIFFPVLLPFAVIATGLVMAAHAALASTANGSWFDVALDAFTLVTMGAGSKLGILAKASRLLAVGESAVIEADAARTAVMVARAGEKAVLEKAASNGLKRFLTPAGWKAASALRGFDAATQALADTAAASARATALARPLPPVSWLEALGSGGKDFAATLKDVRALRDLHPDNVSIANVLRDVRVVTGTNRVAVVVASGIDMSNHFLSHSPLPLLDRLPFRSGWESLKEDEGEQLGQLLHLPGVS